ncbi:MAG: PcfJ domain-containing protein [Bacteroidota bacterium]
MKKRVKKQIKHWKRPSKRQGLSQRAIKKKEADPIYKTSGKKVCYQEEYDDCWNIYYPENDYYFTYTCNPDCCDYYWHENLVAEYNLYDRLLSEIIKIPDTSFSDLGSFKDDFVNKEYSPKKQINKYLLIEKALYEHIKEFERIKTNQLQEKIKYIRETAGNYKNIEIVIRFCESVNNMKLAKAIMLFSPFWIRSPDSWNGKNEISLVKHLFFEYNVPQFLINEWLNKGNYNDFQGGYIQLKWLIWSIIIGQGASIKKISSFFHWRIPNGFQQKIEKLPADITPLEACIYAEIKLMGGNDTDVNRLLGNGAFVIDPTEMESKNTDSYYVKFWYDTIRWLIKYSSDISDDEANDILEWTMHKYTESVRTYREIIDLWKERQNEADTNISSGDHKEIQPDFRLFSLKGRSLRRVIEQSIQYHEQLYLPWKEYSWQKHGWDYEFDDPAYSDWEIVELTNGKELFEEGKALSHCVSGYAGRCVANISAIFSMRYKNRTVITIEVSPAYKKVIQYRGLKNRNANEGEKRVLNEWVNNVLKG